MFTGPNWLEAHKGDLHGQDQADDVEGAVGWRKRQPVKDIQLHFTPKTTSESYCKHIVAVKTILKKRLVMFYMFLEKLKATKKLVSGH